MTEIICNMKNGDISDEEFCNIESKCKKQKHIDERENLKTLIDSDFKKLEDVNIDIDAIKNYIQKILLHFDICPNSISREPYNDIIKKVFSKLNTKGWTCWMICTKKIFNDKLTVIQITWGGAEPCPFKSQLDKEYRGYDYGSVDYIFVKEDGKYMHMSSLLMHQIEKHNFFQGFDSPYRVSPIDFVKFFNLKPNIDYRSDFDEKKYGIWNHEFYSYVEEIPENNIEDKIVFNTFDILKCQFGEESILKTWDDESIYVSGSSIWIRFREDVDLFLPNGTTCGDKENYDILSYDGAIIYPENDTFFCGEYIRLVRKETIIKKKLLGREEQTEWL